MSTFKIIKSKDFTVSGEAHTHYTVAYRGRVFGVSSLRFEEGDFSVDETARTLAFNCKLEVLKRQQTDALGVVTGTYLDLVPKCELDLATF
jgi:hypothetical protein